MVNMVKELSKTKGLVKVEPLEFYRDIFKKDMLDTKGAFNKGKYIGIACEFCNTKKQNGKQLVKRYSITDDLDTINDLLQSENFVIVSPIGYAGKSRKTVNAREMYAFALEIDNIKRDENGVWVGLNDMLFQMQNDVLPTCNYIVASGNGLHLYFILEQPLMLFDNVKKSLIKFKKVMTRFFWNRYITDSYKETDIQFESAFQGFRLAGGITKNGERTQIFKLSDTPITVERLNSYIPETTSEYKDSKIIVAYKSELTLADAKIKYPEWYERRIENKLDKGRWVNKKDLYYWWLRRIKEEVKVGHRYYALMCLCIYAIKCNVEEEELEKDCYSLLEQYDEMSDTASNRFTLKDIADALQIYEDKSLVTYPINSIISRSGINIKKNKRNGRNQIKHCEVMRAIQGVTNPKWREGNGRPKGSGTKQNIILEWQKHNIDGTKSECVRDLKIDKKTVYKWWDSNND